MTAKSRADMMPSTKTPDRTAVVDALRARLSRLETGIEGAAGNGAGNATGAVFSTGCRNIDDSLPLGWAAARPAA